MSTLFSQSEATRILADADEVEAFLRHRLRVGVEHCHAAVAAGHARAALATANSAASQFGSDFYFGTIEELRYQLAPLGFDVKKYAGLELARREDNLVQLTACMATDGAGEVGGAPKPKNPKGSSSEKVINDNQISLGLIAPHASWDPVQTWWLLYQLHGAGDEVAISSEVSFPREMSSPRDFGWHTRVILPPLVLGGAPDGLRLPDMPEEVDVPIVRRSSAA